MKPTALTLLALLLSCKDMGTAPGDQYAFAIYLLKDTTEKAVQAANVPLGDQHLALLPLITEKDILHYHWAVHSIVFQPRIDTLLHAMAGWPYRSWGLPFVVVANGERIYLGAFWWGYSNYMPSFPYIELTTPDQYRISWNPASAAPDPRSDARIREALQGAGVLDF